MASGEMRPGIHGGRGAAAAPRPLLGAVWGKSRIDPDGQHNLNNDPHSRFVQRSQAMGWLDERMVIVDPSGNERVVGNAGLWQMNDGGYGPIGTESRSLAPTFWFQVGIDKLSDSRPLPTEPFLCCAAAVAATLGEFELRAAQLVLPISQLSVGRNGHAASAPSVETRDWFSGALEHPKRVRVSMDIAVGARSRFTPEFASGLIRDIKSYASPVFEANEWIEGSAAHSAFPDRVWQGPRGDGLRIYGSVSGWSLDAIGWVAALLADCAVRRGLAAPLLVTVTLD